MQKNFFLLITLFILSVAGGVAQTETKILPPGFSYDRSILSEPETYRFEFRGNVEKLLYEDAENMKNGAPLRFAVRNPVDILLDSRNMKRSILPSGKNIMQYVIKSDGAEGLILMFDELYIPEGGELYIYDKKTGQTRLFTHADNPSGGRAVSGAIYGDEITLEYVPSPDSGEQPRIRIYDISYIYKSQADIQAAVTCFISTCCSEGDDWEYQIKGVVALSANNIHEWFFCTGSLINNVRQDKTPYILTANHCIADANPTEYSTILCEFFLESTAVPNANCFSQSQTSSRTKTLSGASLVTTTSISGSSDGALLKLDQSIPDSWDVYYNGWDANDIAPTSGVGIHHPNGFVKKISTYLSPATTTTWLSDTEIGKAKAHWNIHWSRTVHGQSVTYGGSSGSPLFNQNGLIVGTLSGGRSLCESPNLPDQYGKMAYHWDKDDDPEKHFKKYLDPDNTGTLVLEGYDPLGIEFTETPEAIAATDLTPVSFTANWKAMENVDKYFLSVYRKGENGEIIYLEGFEDRKAGNALTYSITDLPHNTEYFYSVKGGYRLQKTEPSNEISVTTLPPTFEYLFPVTTEATNISAKSFTANWEALDEANSYFLNVYRKIAATSFNDTVNFTDKKLPAGWKKNSISFYTQNEQYGQAAPALQLSKDSYVESPEYAGQVVKGLSFWYRGISAGTGNSLIVSGLVNGEWIDFKIIMPLSNIVGGVTVTIPLEELPENCNAIKIRHEQKSGYVSIDDIVLNHGDFASLEYVRDLDKFEVGNVHFYTVNNLDSDTEYYYSVTGYNGEKYSKLSNETQVKTTPSAGINPIFDGKTVKPRYFNLQGIEIDKPQRGFIYIEVSGGTSRKVMFLNSPEIN
ncbi:MAG: trypsin-like serine protease [Dysgonamonadaceae bacterium]|jgi:hypothetical protein|nr:trypsin-like serine protease [Dysgonamonadaceae bacterium]